METSWYVEREGRQIGPISWEELVARLQRGEVAAEDRAWSDADAQPRPLGEVEELMPVPVAPPVLDYEGGRPAEIVVTQRALEHLARTRSPAVIVGRVIALLAAFIAFVVVQVLWVASEARFFSPMLVGACGILAAISVFLHRYAWHISELERLGRSQDLELALAAQKWAWRLCAGFIGFMIVGWLVTQTLRR